MIRRILGLTSLVSVCALAFACSSDEETVKDGKDGVKGADGVDATPCTVKEGTSGTSTIECPDGTSVTISNGEDGSKGEPGVKGEPGAEGAIGEPGVKGEPGQDGDPGSSCSVECVDTQTARLSCVGGKEITYPVESCVTTGGPLAVLIEETAFAGALGDPTNPKLSLRVRPGGAVVEELEVQVSSSNETVIPAANITVSGTGRERVVSFAPLSVGVSTLSFSVTNEVGERVEAQVEFAVSAAAADSSGRYYHSASDASTVIDVGDGYMLLASDAENRVYLYKQDESGPPLKSWDFSGEEQLGSESVHIESGARSGPTIVWVGSHANHADGSVAERRRVIFGTTITGSGSTVELSFAGRYGGGEGTKEEVAARGLWSDLVAWDQAKEKPEGFSEGIIIEGFEFSNGLWPKDDYPVSTGFLAFRVPVNPNFYNPRSRARTLIVPIKNVLDLVSGVGVQTGRAEFGANIISQQIDSRAIREIRRNPSGEFLILVSPAVDATTGVNDTWALYTWTGRHTDSAQLNRTLPAPDFTTGGEWEGILSVPDPILPGSKVRLIADSGDTNFYGTGVSRELVPGHRKSYSQEFELN